VPTGTGTAWLTTGGNAAATAEISNPREMLHHRSSSVQWKCSQATGKAAQQPISGGAAGPSRGTVTHCGREGATR